MSSPFALVDQPEEDALGSDEAMVEQARLVLGEHEHPVCPVAEAFEDFRSLSRGRFPSRRPITVPNHRSFGAPRPARTAGWRRYRSIALRTMPKGAVSSDHMITSAACGSRQCMSSGSLVAIRWLRDRAQRTTVASITSLPPETPRPCPAARAPWSSNPTMSQESDPRSRARLAWRRPSRHSWPTTPAGMHSCSPRSRARATSETARRWPRSNATNAPASRVIPASAPR